MCAAAPAFITHSTLEDAMQIIKNLNLFDNCIQQFIKSFKYYKTNGCYLLYDKGTVKHMTMSLFNRSLFIDNEEEFLNYTMLDTTTCNSIYLPDDYSSDPSKKSYRCSNFNERVAHVCFIPGMYTDDVNKYENEVINTIKNLTVNFFFINIHYSIFFRKKFVKMIYLTS